MAHEATSTQCVHDPPTLLISQPSPVPTASEPGTVRSGQSNEPDGTHIVVTIDPCSTHSTPGSSRTFTIDGEISQYDRILARVRNGATKKDALSAEGISESFFGRKRCIAEAARIDLASLRHGLLQLMTPRTLHASGEALPPKKLY